MKDLNTELSDRVLRFDGVSIVDPQQVASMLMAGVHPSQLRVTNLDEDVELFNHRVPPEERLQAARIEPINIDFSWRLPPAYLELDLEEHISGSFIKLLTTRLKDYTPKQVDDAAARIDTELAEIRRRGMTEFVKTIIYVLDTFRERNVVWGVGRGSSCASYVLFILGLHVVDCIRYNVPLTEFYHD